VSESVKNARNVAIVLVIAAAVYFIPGGGRAAATAEAVLWVAFALGVGFLVVRLYREYHMTLYGLGERHRTLLYGAIALAVFEWLGRVRMWQTGLGELAWFVLLAFMGYALLEVYRHWRAY
jgi:hypothetical protein